MTIEQNLIMINLVTYVINNISRNFSAPRTPQQNGVVESKNRTLEDMARTMLLASDLPKTFWAEAVNTACI